MISEALVQSIVRGVLERLATQSEVQRASSSQQMPSRISSTSRPLDQIDQLYQSYRERYVNVPPFDEKFSVEFDSSLPVELGRPLVCIYEAHQPCDSCGRCQVRGF